MGSNIFHGDPILDLGSGYDNLQHGGYVFHWLFEWSVCCLEMVAAP